MHTNLGASVACNGAGILAAHPASCTCSSCAIVTLDANRNMYKAASQCKIGAAHHTAQLQHGSQGQQLRFMACSAGLGRPPPNVITIEYDPNDLEVFIKVADAIEAAFPSVVVNGNEDKDGRPGAFEIQTDDGVVIYSRLVDKASLPSPDNVISLITNRSNLSTDADVANQPFCQ